jgi:hypothetical protein
MPSIRRNAAAILDTTPVLVLAAIAGAGSFTHIRDTATEHGQRGPMAWAVAVCIDLTCVMAARERQRDKRLGAARRMSWPGVVLAGGILLSLAANLAQAQPTAWGRVTAATPCAAFLVAVSMLERRATRTASPAAPVRVVPDEDERWRTGTAVPDEQEPPVMLPVPSSSVRPAPALVDFARRVAAEHEDTHGRPITRDTLRARLGVSNQLASDLLHHIRTTA